MRSKSGIRIFLCVIGVTCCLLSVLSAYQSYTDCNGSPCYHGDCEDGVCSCSSCYGGEQCDTPVNKYRPKFKTPKQDKTIPSIISTNEFIALVEAEDEDYYSTCNEQPCPCAAITYSIESINTKSQSSNFDNAFRIDQQIGAIFANDIGFFPPGAIFDIVVSARNEMPVTEAEDAAYDESITVVTVIVDHNQYMEQEHLMAGGAPYLGESFGSDNYGGFGDSLGGGHIRGKRAAPTTPNLVNNVTFTFEKTGVYENVTVISVGSRVEFALYIQFPVGTTDMLVELFTPDNDTTIMVLCDVVVTVHAPTILTMTGSTDVTYEAKDPLSYDFDRAIIDFKDVTATGSPSAASEAMITITWCAIMIDNSATLNKTVYWVSAGVEYNAESEIWVGQASFTTNLDDTSDISAWDTPTFAMTGPDQIQVGASHVYSVEMCIHYPTTQLSFDAFVPLNSTDAFSICNVLITGVQDYYKCLPYHTFEHQLYEADTGKGNSRGRLDAKTVYNSGSRFTSVGRTYVPAEACITVEFTVMVYNDASLVGSTWWLGAAVEIGPAEIWAAQMAIEVIAQAALPAMGQTPDFTARKIGNDTVTVGQPVVYELDVFIPANTEAEYELEVLMPYNNSAARMHLCSISVVYTGINVPCITDELPVYTSRDGSGIMDSGVWSLGRILNTGQRSTSLDPDANKITFRFVGSTVAHSLNVDGETFWVTAGLKYESQLYVSQMAKIIDTSIVVETETAPDFSMTYTFGDDQVYIGAVTDVQFEITTKPWIFHQPMEIEFILPYLDGAAIYSVCRVEITHVGKNLPCFNQAKMNASIIRTSKSNNEVYDKALLTAGTICNIQDGTDLDVENDKIIFSMKIKVEDHANNTQMGKDWVSTGIKYTPSNLWVGQLALYSIRDTTATYTAENPNYSITRADDPTTDDVPVGLAGRYYITIQLPAQTTGDFTITVTATAGLAICSVRPLEAGYNIPCFDTTKKVDFTTQQTVNSIKYNKVGVLTMGPLTNAVADPTWNATTNYTVFGNNTVRVEIIATPLQVGAESLTVDMNMGGVTTSDVVTVTGVAAVTLVTPDDTIPQFNFSIAPIRENSTVTNKLVKGQAVKFHLDIHPVNNSQHKLNIKFLTPVNDTGLMEICDATVIHIGANIPCLKKEMFVETKNIGYSSRLSSDYIDVAEVDLGHACYYAIVDEEEDPDAGMIRVEAIAKITRDAPVESGETMHFSATAKVNDDHIYVTQHELTVVDDDQFEETDMDTSQANITLNVTDTTVDMAPGEKKKFGLIVTVPPNSSTLVDMDVQTPVGHSAVLTVVSVQVVRSGENLACLATRPEVFVGNYSSTNGTSQNDRVTVSLGVVTNTGATYRSGLYVVDSGDDEFEAEVEVQLTDAEENIDQSEHWLSVGLKMGPSIFVLDKQIRVVRTNNEEPDIELECTVNDTIVYDDQDAIVLDCVLKHTNLSTAEGYNVTTAFYYPDFITFAGVKNNNFTTPSIQDATSSNGVAIEFERLFFTDIASYQVGLTVSPEPSMPPGALEADATTPFEAGCNMRWRPNQVNPPEHWFASRLDSLSYRITAPPSLGDCEIGTIDVDDCQVEGTYSPDSDHMPMKAKTSSGWKTAARGLGFKKYLDVNFGNVTKVSQIKVGDPNIVGASRIQGYKLYYSQDNIAWQTGESVTPIYVAGSSTNNLLAPTDARYVRLEVDDTLAPDEHYAMTVEFSGCTTLGDVLPEDVCDDNRRWGTPSNDVSSNMLVRHVLSVSGTPESYFCDSIDEEMSCFSSADGVQWRTDDSMVNVLGYHASESEMYGIAFDKRSFVSSTDGGDTWFSVPKTRLDEVMLESDYSPAVEVPWVVDGSFGPGINTAVPGNSGNYGGRYDGIINTGTNVRVVNWKQCCTP